MRVRTIVDGRQARLDLQGADGPVTWASFAERLADDTSARYALTSALAALPFDAFAWECNASAAALPSRLVASAAVDSPLLAANDPHPGDFAGPFARDPGGLVTTFANLGGDAILVAPKPHGPRHAYGHFAAFLRFAPAEQVDVLWAAVGVALQARWAADPRPVWLSTAGLGVPWLHVRLDDRPKYYRNPRLAQAP